jgi:hypothetical protein
MGVHRCSCVFEGSKHWLMQQVSRFGAFRWFCSGGMLVVGGLRQRRSDRGWKKMNDLVVIFLSFRS